jgi:Undecaprenyl pyrophosphate synthase
MLKHLACIMDGNRRWAKQHSKMAFEGHRAGLAAAKRVIDYCIEHRIPHLSLYTFSLENFNRSPEELSYLFSLIVEQISESLLREFKQKGVSVRFIGDRLLFPDVVMPACEKIERETADLKNLTLDLSFLLWGPARNCGCYASDCKSGAKRDAA